MKNTKEEIDMKTEEMVAPIIGKSRLLNGLFKKNKFLFFTLYPVLFLATFLIIYRAFISFFGNENYFSLDNTDLLFAFAGLAGITIGTVIIYFINRE